jgi:hypothetical protein
MSDKILLGKVQPSFRGLYDSLEYRGAAIIER